MFPINPFLPLLLLFVLESIVYLAVIAMVLRHRTGQKMVTYLTALYALVALVIYGVQSAWQAGLLPNLYAFTIEQILWYSTLALSLLLLLILYAFLEKKNFAIWLGLGAFWVAMLVLLSLNIFQLPDTLWSNDTWLLPRERVGYVIVFLGWLSFSLASFFTYRRAYKDTRQPLHRNRLRYWLLIFALLFSADLLFIENLPHWGTPLRLVGIWLLGYIVISHHLPDLQEFFRSALIYISTTLLAGIFYAISFGTAQVVFPEATQKNPLIIGAVIAILLATFFRPLLKFIEGVVDPWLGIDQLDVSQTVNEYSKSISNIIDVTRLADVTVNLIMEAMGIQRGFLFLVDKNAKTDTPYYTLRAVRDKGERPINTITLNDKGPIATYFLDEKTPLLQFDLDLLPEYKLSYPEERNRLNHLNTEIYVPIFSQNEWIGLFALGGKISGNRYSKENLLTLSALASQTAVALENARLVENLLSLNNQVRDAYRDLKNTKRDLEKIDRTKSDFISIASHELRTPLTVMRGYTEMLLESPSLDKMMLKMLKGIHEGTMRLHEVVDGLFDIAQIDARTLELELEPIDVGRVVQEVCIGLKQALDERDQKLKIDLPPIPGIQADPNTLRKVFYHLISNAIKFTPNNGRIMVRGRTLSFGDEKMPEGGIELIISDTGIGIDPNFKEVIFTKFYQPGEQLNHHSTGKTKFKGSGTGLGLALSRGIVEAHGGKVWAESPGYDEINFPGSHFHVILPLRKQLQGDTLPISKAINIII